MKILRIFALVPFLLGGLLSTQAFAEEAQAAPAAPKGQATESPSIPFLTPPETPREVTLPAEDLKLGYQLGKGLHLKSGDGKYSLNFRTTIISSYGYVWTEGVRVANENALGLASVGTSLSGNVLNEQLRWGISTGWFPSVGLRSGSLSYRFLPELSAKIGKFGNPHCGGSSLNTQIATISGAVAQDHFCPGGDVGASFSGGITKWFDYNASVFNNGTSGTKSANEEMLFGTRLNVYLVGQEVEFDKLNMERVREPQLSLGGGTLYNTGDPNEITTNRPNDISNNTVDVAFSYYGFYVEGAGYHLRNMTLRKTDVGFYGNAGYLIVPGRLDVAAHYSGVIPGKAGSAIPITGVTQGAPFQTYDAAYTLTYYVFGGEEFQIQGGFQTIYNKAGIRNLNDNQVNLQLTASF